MWSDNEAKEDLLGFQYLADGIVSIVKNERLLPATLGVFGDWGGGKSTLIEMVKTCLELAGRKGRRGGCAFLQRMAVRRL